MKYIWYKRTNVRRSVCFLLIFTIILADTQSAWEKRVEEEVRQSNRRQHSHGQLKIIRQKFVSFLLRMNLGETWVSEKFTPLPSKHGLQIRYIDYIDFLSAVNELIYVHKISIRKVLSFFWMGGGWLKRRENHLSPLLCLLI